MVVQKALIPIFIDHALVEIVEVGYTCPARIGNNHIQAPKERHRIFDKLLQSRFVTHIRTESFKSWFVIGL